MAATILNGAVAPTNEGADGDFYIDTVLHKIHGPKATTWPAGVSLVGSTGAAGADGNSVLHGVVAPTSNDGVAGDFFIDTVLKRFWGPRTTNWTDNSYVSIDRTSIAGSIWAEQIVYTPSDWIISPVAESVNITAKNIKTGEAWGPDTIANFNIKIAVNGY
jgi:hypothetical protein